MLAKIFEIPPSEVCAIGGGTEGAASVYFEENYLEGHDYPEELSVFPYRPSRIHSDVDLATAIARILGAGVLGSFPAGEPQAHIPFLWILVQPDGQRFKVLQRPECEPAIIIDRNSLTPWKPTSDAPPGRHMKRLFFRCDGGHYFQGACCPFDGWSMAGVAKAAEYFDTLGQSGEPQELEAMKALRLSDDLIQRMLIIEFGDENAIFEALAPERCLYQGKELLWSEADDTLS
ncbi:hypothetical protein LZC95_01725 [Pendulispora brunnea]|uniref:Uncharacterized protein n=1 Tax=Pendulispora brunnea TaxID=2905690 RepID=A0ABZ2KA96_9BACT